MDFVVAGVRVCVRTSCYVLFSACKRIYLQYATVSFDGYFCCWRLWWWWRWLFFITLLCHSFPYVRTYLKWAIASVAAIARWWRWHCGNNDDNPYTECGLKRHNIRAYSNNNQHINALAGVGQIALMENIWLFFYSFHFFLSSIQFKFFFLFIFSKYSLTCKVCFIRIFRAK